MIFYRTTHSSIHASISASRLAPHAERSCLIPTTSRACYKTSRRSDNPAWLSEMLLSLLSTQHFVLRTVQRLFPSIVVVVRPLNGKQAYLPSQQKSEPSRFAFVFTLHFLLLPRPFPLNRRRSPYRRGSYACLPQKIVFFLTFCAVVKYPRST